MNQNIDSGNISGTLQGGASTIHGGRTGDSRIYADGNNMGWFGGGGGGGNMPQVASSQEVVMTTSGGLGEAETAGVIVNVIPREGANTFNGQFNFSGSNGALQGSNYTQALKDAGLQAPSELDQRVRRQPDGRRPDPPGQALVLRHLPPDRGGADGPGDVGKQERRQPECLDGRFRPSPSRRLPIRCNARRPIRLTWQATPRNKFNIHWAEQYNDSNYAKGGGSATTTPEATVRGCTSRPVNPTPPGRRRCRAGSCWRPAGACTRRGSAGTRATTARTTRSMIQTVEQGGEIPNLTFRMGQGPGLNRDGFEHSLIGTLAALRASASYVTGAHNLKFGYQGGFSNPSNDHWYTTEVINIRMRDGVPNRLTQTIVAPNSIKYVRNLIPDNFYAQDQWTRDRLTLQGGVRYDSLLSNYPDSSIGGPGFPYGPT